MQIFFPFRVSVNKKLVNEQLVLIISILASGNGKSHTAQYQARFLVYDNRCVFDQKFLHSDRTQLNSFGTSRTRFVSCPK